jgi:hypothetical protein
MKTSRESTLRNPTVRVDPLISGQPHRIKYLEAVYDHVNRQTGVIHWQGREILEWYLATRRTARE